MLQAVEQHQQQNTSIHHLVEQVLQQVMVAMQLQPLAQALTKQQNISIWRRNSIWQTKLIVLKLVQQVTI